jgi:phenylalanyl-tRNA synthetase alpha chain
MFLITNNIIIIIIRFHRIEKYCQSYITQKLNNSSQKFHIFDQLNPIVHVKNNFDNLRVDKNHISRNSSDTYYLNDDVVLRTHTSAHQCDNIRNNEQLFLCCGDVYRRDEVDSSHYPVFHQMEGNIRKYVCTLYMMMMMMMICL